MFPLLWFRVASAPPRGRCLLQASEQYSTCSQLRAQARRHVIVRPQTAQGLEGREDLLPFQLPE